MKKVNFHLGFFLKKKNKYIENDKIKINLVEKLNFYRMVFKLS